MLSMLTSGIAAGIVISLGGGVFLACENRVVGAVLFSVALLCICMKSYSLFTGKVGFLPHSHTKKDWVSLLLALAGNAVGAALGGLALRYALPSLGTAAETLCSAKLAQGALQTLIRGGFCGLLMYLAVSIWRERQTPLGVLFCIPVFILSGYEHSIADMFYFAAAGQISWPVLAFLGLTVLGNSLGSVLLPLLTGERGKTNG